MLISSAGAFVAAPVGGMLWALGAMALRLLAKLIWVKVRGGRFDAFDRPVEPPPPSFYTGRLSDDGLRDEVETIPQGTSKINGKFF